MEQVKEVTKEEWEHWREQSNIPIDIWYSFYKEKGGYLDTLESFTQVFLSMINEKMIVQGSGGVMKQITNISAFGKMKTHYDTKFGIG